MRASRDLVPAKRMLSTPRRSHASTRPSYTRPGNIETPLGAARGSFARRSSRISPLARGDGLTREYSHPPVGGGAVGPHDVEVTGRPATAQHLRDLARLRRVRDRIDREYAQPLDVDALARDAHMSAGYLSRRFRLAYGESPDRSL